MKDYASWCSQDCPHIDYKQMQQGDFAYKASYCRRYKKEVDYYDGDLRLEECIEEFELEVCDKCKGRPVQYIDSNKPDDKDKWSLKTICKVCDCTGIKHNITYNKDLQCP